MLNMVISGNKCLKSNFDLDFSSTIGRDPSDLESPFRKNAEFICQNQI